MLALQVFQQTSLLILLTHICIWFEVIKYEYNLELSELLCVTSLLWVRQKAWGQATYVYLCMYIYDNWTTPLFSSVQFGLVFIYELSAGTPNDNCHTHCFNRNSRINSLMNFSLPFATFKTTHYIDFIYSIIYSLIHLYTHYLMIIIQWQQCVWCC